MLASDPAIEIVPDAAQADVVVGARRISSQDVAADQIVAAVHAAAAGLQVMPVEAVLEFPRRTEMREPIEEIIEPLTPRETDVLEMLAEGLSNKMIAHRLAISEHTAKFHVNSILTKLNAGTRTEAVTRGIRLGLIQL